MLIPVRLPLGRARLVTRPSLTGSSETEKRMGIVVVASLAASAVASPQRWRSPRPAGGPDRPPVPAGDRSVRPSGSQSLRSRPRHSRSLSGPGERRVGARQSSPAIRSQESDHRHCRLLRARRQRPRRRRPPSAAIKSRRLISAPPRSRDDIVRLIQVF